MTGKWKWTLGGFVIAALMQAQDGVVLAQAKGRTPPKIDLSLTYQGERANPVSSGGNFWLQGGAIEGGFAVTHGLGIAASFSATHSADSGPSHLPLSLLTIVAGPRYRWTRRSDFTKRKLDLSPFGEALVGTAHGFHSTFPSPAGVTESANSIAFQVGGGVDLDGSSRLTLRLLQANWLRTQLPNSTSNIQNDFRVGAGLVLHFGKRR